MLQILGSPKTLCNGITRRELLQAGTLSLFGLSLADYHRLRAATRPQAVHKRFGQARACILLYLYGSPSQLELCDMKPVAPVEVRGEFKPIRSTLPGCDVCEHLPHMARVMDRVTVIRSVTHPYPIHGIAYATTGVPAIDVAMELSPRDPRHWPFIGSVVDYLGRDRRRSRGIPDNIALPFPLSSRREGEVPRAGPYAAFLGTSYNPIWTDFEGRATRRVVKTLGARREEIADPYLGITEDSRFVLAGASALPEGVTLDRLDRRRRLVEQLDGCRRLLDRALAQTTSLDRYRGLAYDLIYSDRLRRALDLQREDPRLRRQYGLTLFGQATLVARRLVEAGSRFVTVFWDEYGLAGSGWDTHWDHYPRMKEELLPGLDRAFAGLVEDLDQRGMLDETLVVVLSEHGRTPRLTNAPGGGRDHWSQAYTVLMAGGGIARGRVIGRTDRIGATVVERPVSPKDILATVYYLLGIDPETHLTDRSGRPLPLVPEGHVLHDALA
ncbi:MAG: DUF1501 domain-containing protein [Gemmataceae bacterium]